MLAVGGMVHARCQGGHYNIRLCVHPVYGMPQRSRSHRGGKHPAILGGRGRSADHDGKTPLNGACLAGHTEVVRTLLSARAKVDLPDKIGFSPLHAACLEGHMEGVRALLSGEAKVDPLTTDGMTPLYGACFMGHTEVVRTLLSARAKVDLPDKNGRSPLHAACHGGHVGVVRALLSGGAKVDPLARNGSTPLHAACDKGHIGVVPTLLSAGARADLRNVNGMTPLDLLPRGLCAEVGCLVQQERGSSRADESRVGAPSAPEAVLPTPQCNQPASCRQSAKVTVQAPLRVMVGCRLRPASAVEAERVCSMCGGPPSASASSGSVAKLKACGNCKSVQHCSPECQKKHWGQGGHKAACPQLRETREKRKHVKAERL